MVRRWLQSADVEITDNGEQLVANRSASTATTAAVGVTSDGAMVLAANPNRISAVLCNDSDTDIYIKLGDGPAVGSGILLKAYGGSFAVTAANLYTGQITAVCTATDSKNLLVTEY